MALSLKQVRYFIAAADIGQISQAAVELNVSQSAVTAAIQQLELDLSVRLFTRGPTGVSLTAEGTRFLQHARNIIAAVNQATRIPLNENSQVGGSVRVGVTYTVAGYFMPGYYARFARVYPNIHLELIELPRSNIERGLVNGQLDTGVILVSNIQDKKRLASEMLLKSRRRLWLPIEHPLLEQDEITLQDVATEPYVMLTVDEADQTAGKYWRGTGLKPRTIFNTSSIEAVRSMVAAGTGVTILSDMVHRPWSLEGQKIETRAVLADIPTMDVGLAWSRKHRQSEATRTFHDFMHFTISGAG